MSVSLSAERDRIQRQVEQLEQSLSATHPELELLSSETDDDSDGDDTGQDVGQSAAGLLAQREKIQKEIQNLENVLGPHSSICVSDDDSSSSEESELGLSLSVDSCLQMNLVYQQVVQETLDQLETLLTHNQRQQKEVVSQLSGPIKEPSREQHPPSSCEQPINMFLGRFLKPYFKDKLTGLGPPANQETKEKASRMAGCMDNKKLKVKRWESWQKTLLIHSVARDGLKRLIQPKLSRVDYLSQKLSTAEETDRQQLREQIDSLERDIDLLRGKKEEELIADRYEEHDWQKIANIDFEGTRKAEDIRCFWQNFLHPSISKDRWSQEEVQQLKEVSRRHGERDWEAIATELGTGRTAFLCLQTFQRFVSASLRRSTWTPAEDALLRELVDKMRIGNFIPYTQMSYFMEGRDPPQLIYRWNQVLDPSLKKGPWTKEEDQLLLQAVSCYGERDWWKIRLMVPGRTDSSCRDRYYDCLKVDTKRGPFDQQERELLLQLVEKHGVGRWAKIAAEIPHRLDAQCLREWRKLNKPAATPAQKRDKAKKPPTSRGGAKKKKTSPVRKRIRKRLKKIKEEEDTEEEEDMVVEYMDSDEEEKKTKEDVKVSMTEEVEKEQEEVEYTFPPMQEWVPTEKEQSFTFLNFRPVEFPSSGDVHNGKPVRSTILGQFGRSVVIGPSPRVLQWEERHSNSSMMMVSPDQLRAYLRQQADKFSNLNSSQRGKVQNKRNRRPTDRELEFELQAVMTPWIGNLLIPEKSRQTAADALREQGEKSQLSSTAIFLLLLQAMNVDSVGCKEMIEQRNQRVVLPTPPPESPSFQTKTPRPQTVARILQQRKDKEDLQKSYQRNKLILQQLPAMQQQQKQRQQQLLQSQPQELLLPQQTPLPCSPSMPPQNRPGILLQMPPNMHPRMSPVFPQAVFISNPVTKPSSASMQPKPPSSLTPILPAPCRPPPAVIISSQLLAPPAPHRLNVPSVSMVPLPLNITSTCSDSVQQQARPLTQKLIASLPPPPNQHVSVGSVLPGQQAVAFNSSGPITCPSQPSPAPSPSNFISNPLQDRGQKETEDQHADGSGLNGLDSGGAGDGVMEEGRRIRKLSLKARDLQEAGDARATVKEKASSSSQKKAQIKNSSAPAQTLPPPPPQQVCTAPVQLLPQTPQSTTPPTATQNPPPAVVASSPLSEPETPSPPSVQEPASSPLRLNLPPGSMSLSQNATPACSDMTVSSTQNVNVDPPPSIPTHQHTASSTSSRPAALSRDHDYAFCYPSHTQSQDDPTSVQPSPSPKRHPHCKSDSALNRSPKAPPKGRKRARRERQPSVTSSQDDQHVGNTGDVVGRAATGVTQDGKRVRKPSQKARAFQEAIQAKAEAKKRTSVSSPLKKRSRTTRSKKGIVIQKQPVAQEPGLRLYPSRSMLVMTPGRLVPLAQAPPPGLQLALLPSSSLPAQPTNVFNCQSSSHPLQLPAGTSRLDLPPPTAVTHPINLPRPNQPCTFSAPPLGPSSSLPPRFILQPVPNSPSVSLTSCTPKHPQQVFLPYKGAIRADPAAPPPLRKEALQFDPSLMFLESGAEVRDWLSGQGGVVVPGAGVALPYLPPFVSSLSMLSALLRAKKSLTRSSLQWLCRGSEPQHPDTNVQPESSTKMTTNQPSDLPDSTSDLSPATDKPASSVNLQQEEEEADEEELVAAVRQLVAERFSSNPAYQMLKARFLSCFTLPAFLATVQPITEKTGAPQASEEDEEEREVEDGEEVEELKKIKERGKKRRAERSLLLCDESEAPANHFSGLIDTNTPSNHQTSPDQ